jgi:lysophospholipase L1-like esterase
VILLAVLANSYLPTGAAKSVPFAQTITAPAIVNYPGSIASTGDSITRAFNTGSIPFTDSAGNSWSTGTNSTVMSHYSRILIDHTPISGHSFNDAVTGAQMVDLNSQVQSAVTQGVAYVTILLGANDACTDTEAQMTPVATYRAQFQTALNTVTAGLPDARIFVLSVPNVYNLWFILKDDASARSTWNLFGICQSLLANPTSTAQADVDRRNRVKQRVIDYNTQLAQVCATSIHCKFDNNAAFNTNFVPSDVSTRDYFHPTIAGQAKIATVSYGATFDFREGVPPATVATLAVSRSKNGGSRLFTFAAVDNAGVAGIEYKINSGAWIRYGSPVSLANGSSLTYRAVDVNGNIEEARTISPSPAASQ